MNKLCELIMENQLLTLTSIDSDLIMTFNADGHIIESYDNVKYYWKVSKEVLYIFGESNGSIDLDNVRHSKYNIKLNKFFIGDSPIEIIFDDHLFDDSKTFIISHD